MPSYRLPSIRAHHGHCHRDGSRARNVPPREPRRTASGAPPLVKPRFASCQLSRSTAGWTNRILPFHFSRSQKSSTDSIPTYPVFHSLPTPRLLHSDRTHRVLRPPAPARSLDPARIAIWLRSVCALARPFPPLSSTPSATYPRPPHSQLGSFRHTCLPLSPPPSAGIRRRPPRPPTPSRYN